MTSHAAAHAASPARGALVLRVVIAAALVVDAVVHLRLAGGYQGASSGGIGEGTIFRVEAAVAIIVALLVLVTGNRASYVLAFVVGISAVAAVVLYRYVQVPAIGPLPSMYEPVWFFQKSLSAVAEAAVAVLSAIALGAHRRRR